jgi:acyl carrier protein
MNRDAVMERVRKSIVTTFRLQPDSEIDRETTSADVNGWDSLSHAMLIMQVEQDFGVELPFDRVYDLANVGELADLVKEALSAGAQPT